MCISKNVQRLWYIVKLMTVSVQSSHQGLCLCVVILTWSNLSRQTLLMDCNSDYCHNQNLRLIRLNQFIIDHQVYMSNLVCLH